MSQPTDQRTDITHLILREMRNNFARLEAKVDKLDTDMASLSREMETVKTTLRKVEVVQDATLHMTGDMKTEVKVLISAVSRNDKDIAGLQSGKQDKA
jgi:prefoldin subunit 5